MDPVERIERASAFAQSKVEGVQADDMTKPTPCSEFDVRALLNHLIGGLAMMETAASGGKAVAPTTDQLGDDAAKTFAERRQKLLATLGESGVMERSWEMPFGAMPGAMMAGITFMEHVTHGWDVATATGQDATIPADLLQECWELVTPMDAMLRMPGVCGPAVAVADDASLQDKFVAFMGRTP